jgi:hypothetical protein
MTLILKICAISLKLAASATLAADAIGTDRPLTGLLVGFVSLVPLAWGLQDMLGPDMPASAP